MTLQASVRTSFSTSSFAMHTGFQTSARGSQSTSPASAWRFIVLSNRTQAGLRNTYSQIRIDSAHTVCNPGKPLNWTTDTAVNVALERVGSIQVDCLPASPVVAREAAPMPIERRMDEPMASASQVSARLAGNHLQLKSMLAEAAHDIRTPLGVARQILNRLSTQVRGRGSLSHQDMELLESANERLQQATEWVDGILVPGKLAGAEQPNIRQRFYPHQLLNILRPIVEPLARAKGVKLEWIGWDRSLPRLLLDANKLTRVMLNLIENAIEASETGDPVQVKVAWQNNVTQRLLLSVEDQGAGLPKPLLSYLNGSSGSRAPMECGIGLQTVKALSGSLGTFSAQIVPRGGSLMRITVPVDNRAALIRSWLIQQSREVPQRGTKRSPGIGLMMLRSVGADANRVDRMIQERVSANDFVYRVSEDRWLMLSMNDATIHSDGMANMRREIEDSLDNAGSLHGQLVYVWPNVDLSQLHFASDERNLLPHLSQAVAQKFDELAGNRVPPIDQLQGGWDRSSMRKPASRGQIVRVDTSADQKKAMDRHTPISTGSTIPQATAGAIDLLNTDPEVFSKLPLQWAGVEYHD